MAIASDLVTAEEYLRRESETKQKNEFRKGSIFPMPGASANHVIVASNLHGVVWPLPRRKGCLFLNPDAKVWIEEISAFYYPDGSIACPPNWVDRPSGAYDNPIVLFEIVSPSSERNDRGTKFKDYATLPSLQEYVLIESDAPDLQVFRREGPDQWSLTFYSGMDRVAKLASLDVEISLADLFETTSFDVRKEG